MPPPSNGLAAASAEFCIGLDAASLPREAVHAFRMTVLDCIASMLAGSAEPVSAQALAAVGEAREGGDCSIVGFVRRLQLRDAAFVNGTIAHACDYDDSSWTMWGHPTAPLLPALLACAESRRCSGKDLVAALAVGIEIEKTLGRLMQPEHYRRGWHPTATLGLFGAVAGAGRLFGLSVPHLQAAFGIAASMAAGLRCNAGYGAKPLHAGLAARNGIEAVLLARAGVSANPLALDGEGGFLTTYGASHADRTAETIACLGRPFEVTDPGLSPKLYPCCSDTHCAIDAVLDAKAELGFTAADIAAVHCFVGSMAEPNVRRRDPATPVEAKFSMSYCVACAIVLGRVGLAQFTPEALASEPVRMMAARVTVGIDPSLDEGGATFSSPARVDVDLRDGRRLRRALRTMRGHPQRPLSAEEMRTKFFECAGSTLTAQASSSLYAVLCNIETLPDIHELMHLASGRQG